MKEFQPKTVCILGRQPALGLAELESIYGAEHVRPLGNHALLDIPTEEIDFKRLGGTIKVTRVLAELPYSNWPRLAKYLTDKIPEHLQHLPEGKFTLGISIYDLKVGNRDINRAALEIKSVIKKTGRPVRVVPNKSAALNSAQVLHNRLTHKGAWELVYISYGSRALLAQTLFVQDIEAYGARDQARPARDARVGMLPPKLAQVLVNLASGPLQQSTADLTRVRVLDPFCGTGVVLQEALLMGYSVIGTDIDKRMVDYSKKNIKWLFQKYPMLEGSVDIEQADATTYDWPGFSTIASEVFLGRPLAKRPSETDLKQIVSDANTIIKKFLQNLSPQLQSGRTFCIAVPAWRRPGGQIISLPVLAKLTDMGYNYLDLAHVLRKDLVYYREDQIVARQLLRLKKV